MTNYTSASEEQRDDVYLKACIAHELIKHRRDLLKASTLMLEAYDILARTPNVDARESFVTPTGVQQARSTLLSDSKNLKWKADFLGTISDTYLGNLAAFMSAEQAQKLKDKYIEDSADR